MREFSFKSSTVQRSREWKYSGEVAGSRLPAARNFDGVFLKEKSIILISDYRGIIIGSKCGLGCLGLGT